MFEERGIEYEYTSAVGLGVGDVVSMHTLGKLSRVVRLGSLVSKAPHVQCHVAETRWPFRSRSGITQSFIFPQIQFHKLSSI